MRIVFAGSPAAAVPSLERLALEHEILAVVTRAPSRVGRARTLKPTAVGHAAERLGLPVIEADRLDAAATSAIEALEPELGVIVAYGGLVREPLLSAPREGWINVHFSLLPAYRGAAPVQRALIDGVTTTGVSVFHLVPALDAGDLIATHDVPVPERATAGDLLDDLAHIGARVLAGAVEQLAAGTAVRVPQSGSPSLAPKLTIDDGLLDLTESGARVLDRFRGVTPEPGAHVRIDGERCKVLGLAPAPLQPASDAAPIPAGEARLVGRDAMLGTATVPLLLERVQPAGKRPMLAADWLRGRGGAAVVDAASIDREARDA